MEAPISTVGISLISQPADAIIDIVFVHGLQGHPQRTWSSRGRLSQKTSGSTSASYAHPSGREKFLRFPRWLSKHKGLPSGDDATEGTSNAAEDGQREMFWPRDLLKEDFPTARIMTFGYNSRIVQGLEAANQSNIFSHARNLLYELESKRRLVPDRHLVFIVHSLGGIIVKEALRRSDVDPDPKINKLFNSTTGVFFFGTPHRGSKDWASFGEGITKVASLLLGLDSNDQIVHALLPSGPELDLCRESFITQWMKHMDRLTVRTFQESKGVTGVRWANFNMLIVPSDSSSLDHPNQRPRTVDADHIEMVKFSGRDDKVYEMVCADIYELVSNAENTLQNQPGRNSKLSGMDYMKRIPLPSTVRPANQTGSTWEGGSETEESLEWFSDSPEFKSWISADDSSFLWLHGVPGDGKTVVAIHTQQNLSKCNGYSRERDVASVFCSRGETEIGIVLSLASQLSSRIDRANAEQNNAALPDFSKDYSEEADLTRDIWKLLEALIVLLPGYEVIFILDGVDEIGANTRSQFLRSLHYLEKKTRGKAIIRVLISSRDYPDIREALDHYVTIERGKELKEFLDTLRYEEWNARENKISDAQEGGTWLSSSKDYKEWLASPSSDVLWIAGKPGSGKSTLVKLVMKMLQEKHSDGGSGTAGTHGRISRNFEYLEQKKTIFASFYYSFRGGNTEMSHELMLRSIAYQIFRQNDRLFALIRDRFRKIKSERLLWSYHDLKSILQSLHDVPFEMRVFIAVDGLDESDNALRIDVLEFLSKLPASKSQCIVKVLIASRPEIDIRPWINRVRHISLEKKNHGDIRIILKSGVKKLEQFRQSTLDHEIAPPEPQDQKEIFTAAETYILENSRGVFLWVVLVLKELEIFIRQGGYSLEDIDECVRSLPTELGGSKGFYAVMLERLVRQTSVTIGHESRGRRIFAWITFSTRPLLVSELKDALAVPPQLTKEANLATFDLARARPIDLERGLSTFCGGFTELRTTDNILEKPPGVSVQLIHQTVREFLLSKDHVAQPYDMDEFFGDTEVAGTCCRYIHLAFIAAIAQNEADTNFSLAGKLAKHLSNWHLLPYALTNLATHLTHLGSKRPATVVEFEHFITQLKGKPTYYSSLLLSLWVQSQSWLKPLSIPAESDAARECLDSTLLCAASEGQTNATNTLLILGATATRALYTASYGGHERTVMMLLDAKAEVNVQGGEYGNSLQAASKGGHMDVVNLLRYRKADINAQGGYYGNALQAASQGGHEEVVVLLIDIGADVNAQGGYYGNAIQAASQTGHEKVVQILLEKGADFNAQGGDYGNALLAASQGGHENVVDLLVARGADVNAQGKNGTALQAASQGGHEKVVQILLEVGADVNAQGGMYGTALQAASQGGHEKVVQILINNGAEIEAHGGRHGDAL